MEMQDVADARLTRENDVLVSMARAGICGSDVHYFSEGGIGSQRVAYPWTVGHEGAGTVVSVGASVTRVKTGDRIAFDPGQPCWKCDQCIAGRPNTCRNMVFMGCPGQIEGCLAERIVIPESSCYKIPDTMSFDQAALVEPLSIALHGLHLSAPMLGAVIGILGAGPIGLSVLLPAKAWGARRIYVTDKIDARLQLALTAGADWVGNSDVLDAVAAVSEAEPELLDVVFECTGDQGAMDDAVKMLKPGGKLMLIGIPGALNRVSFDINLLRRKEICIQNVRRQNGQVQPAIDMIANKVIDADVMITHRLPFPETEQGFNLVTDYQDGVIKAMIEFN